MATVLSDIRSFLARHGVRDASPDGLLVALHARREDTSFWGGLQALLADLCDVRVSARLVEGRSKVADRPLAALLGDLRVALPARTPDVAWLRALPTAALAAFVVLGTACAPKPADSGDTSDTSDTSDTGEPLCEEATTYKVTEEPDVYCDLVALIQGSERSTDEQWALIACLADFSASSRAALLAKFEAMSEEELNQALFDLAYSDDCDYDPGH